MLLRLYRFSNSYHVSGLMQPSISEFAAGCLGLARTWASAPGPQQDLTVRWGLLGA